MLQKIVWAALVIGMIALLWPQTRRALKHAPKGSVQDWLAAALPLALVIGFVLLLMALV